MEEILKLLGAEHPFDDNGDLTPDGADKYDVLIRIVERLHRIGAISEAPDRIEEYFDKIMTLGY